jgi:hypothetical protein
MIMVSCEYCGDSTGGLTYMCNYCGAAFCQSHRLPEAHDCRSISETRPPTSVAHEAEAVKDKSRGARSTDEIDLGELRERAKQETQPYSVVEVEETVGTKPEPDFASSPDVAIDGSIASEETSDRPTTDSRKEISSSQIIALLVVVVILLLLVGIIAL